MLQTASAVAPKIRRIFVGAACDGVADRIEADGPGVQNKVQEIDGGERIIGPLTTCFRATFGVAMGSNPGALGRGLFFEAADG